MNILIFSAHYLTILYFSTKKFDRNSLMTLPLWTIEERKKNATNQKAYARINGTEKQKKLNQQIILHMPHQIIEPWNQTWISLSTAEMAF